MRFAQPLSGDCVPCRAALQPVGSFVAVPDFSQRPPQALGDGERVQLSHKTLTAAPAPWVHFWNSMLVDVPDRVLFASDLFL